MRICFIIFFIFGVGLIDVNAINVTLWLQIVLGLKSGNGASGILIPESYPCYLGNAPGVVSSYCATPQCIPGDTVQPYYCALDLNPINGLLNLFSRVGTCQLGLVCCPSKELILCPNVTIPSSGIQEQGLCSAGATADLASWCEKRDCSSNQTAQYCPLNLPQGPCADNTLACCPAAVTLPCNATLAG